MNRPRTKRNKGNKVKVEGQKLKIQEILDTLDAPSAPLDGSLPANSPDTATTSTSESGAPSAPSMLISCKVLTAPTFSIAIFQLADVWSGVRSLCMNSPP